MLPRDCCARRPLVGPNLLVALLCVAGAPARPATAASAAAEPGVAELLRDPARLVQLLRSNSPDVAAASARVDQALAGQRAATLYPNPGFLASAGGYTVGTTNPPGLGYRDTGNYALGVSETFELGKRRPRIASAREAALASRESYLATIGERAAGARTALARVVQFSARQAFLEDSLAGARRVDDLERVREQGGDLSGNDFDRLRLDTLSLESEVARSRAEYEAALAACRALLAISCEPGGARLADLDLLPSGLPPGVPPGLEELEGNPELRAIEHDARSAELDAVLARRRAIPDPNLAVSYLRDNLVIAGNQPRTWQVSATFALPLFDRGQHDAARAEARAREARETRRAALARADSDLRGLLARRSFLETALAQFEREAVPKSRSILETTQKALDQGEASMTDLLLARRTQTAILLNQLDLRFELFSVNNELRRLLGLDAELARAETTTD